MATLDTFVASVVVLGLLTKFAGGLVGNLIAGGSSRESVVIGVGMMPKAGIELAIVTTALTEELITGRLFSALVVLVLVSVLVTPSLLQLALRQRVQSVCR